MPRLDQLRPRTSHADGGYQPLSRDVQQPVGRQAFSGRASSPARGGEGSPAPELTEPEQDMAKEIASYQAAHRQGKPRISDEQYDETIAQYRGEKDPGEHSLRARRKFTRTLQGGEGKVGAVVAFDSGTKVAVLSVVTCPRDLLEDKYTVYLSNLEDKYTVLLVWDLVSGTLLQTVCAELQRRASDVGLEVSAGGTETTREALIDQIISEPDLAKTVLGRDLEESLKPEEKESLKRFWLEALDSYQAIDIYEREDKPLRAASRAWCSQPAVSSTQDDQLRHQNTERAITANKDGWIEIWRLNEQGQLKIDEQQRWQHPEKLSMRSIKVCSGGKRAVMLTHERHKKPPNFAVWVVDLDPRQVKHRFHHLDGEMIDDENPVNSLQTYTFSPALADACEHVVSCSRERYKQIKIWRLAPATQKARAGGGPDFTRVPALSLDNGADVRHCSVYLDGKRLLSCCADFKMRIWNIEYSMTDSNHGIKPAASKAKPAEVGKSPSHSWSNALPLAVLVGHTGKVKSCSIIPDGCQALSCSDDGTVRVWDLLHVGLKAKIKKFVEPTLTLTSAAKVAPTSGWIEADENTFRETVRDQRIAIEEIALQRRETVRDQRIANEEIALQRAIKNLRRRDARFSKKTEAQMKQHWEVMRGRAVRRCIILTDSMHIVAGYNDGTLAVFDVADGQHMYTLRGHRDAIVRMTLLDKTSRFLTGSLNEKNTITIVIKTT
eukprot:COSAG01_NODE_4473_length_4989_cov_3.564826_3_plen_721_part_00